jgi:transposase
MTTTASVGDKVVCQLLPGKALFQLENCQLDEVTHQITLIASSTKAIAQCPLCQQLTHRVHSRYERKLTDLPWADYRISLQLRVQKFFCINAQCKRRIFTERLGGVTAPWARKTKRLAEKLTAIGLSLGGNAGVYLSKKLGFVVSRNTLLQMVRRIPFPPVITPVTLGVDDFAFRKHHTYGTILVDLEQSRPIALLKDRESETLSAWLQAHPGVKMVSRDRSKAYEKGIRQGAPQAIQVADRFHLLQNLSQTLEQVFSTHALALKEVEKQVFNTDTKVLKEVVSAHNQTLIAETNVCPVVPRYPQNTSLKRKVQSELAQHRRRTIHEQVWSLRSQGLSGQAIAAELGVSKTTVFNYLRSSTFNERRQRSDQGLSLLNPYHDYLLSRWNSGYYNTQKLFEEIVMAGYTGSYATVVRFTRYLKSLPGFEPAKGSTKKAFPKVSSSSQRPLTPSRVTALVLRRPELTEPNEREAIAQLQTAHSDLKSAIELAQQFASLVRQRLPEQLDTWLDKAKNSSVSLLHSFAVGLESDYNAVKAGVTMSLSNGPVEGHINRLKMLKRQMYGRAKLDLLERRFLLTT